ncbi:cytochrome P450 [Nocardia arthritidis]|uniref:Cytochrome P450 n=1 Tax=Nocardia arthritidis TaxID=228602 RepID=A0A6G9YBD7_9NOCA|nr:cytochrome P450 [Nocardia arthritidis]QIS10478.1 cytochrome P450 [Nocardia arthritidis]
MTTASRSGSEPVSVISGLPLDRQADRPFDPPAEQTRLREREPLVRMDFPDGHRGWLATDHATVRAVLADARFSSRSSLQHSPFEGIAPLELPPGTFIRYDPPEHTRFRKLLTGKFTVRRMRLLTERIEEFSAERLDALERRGGPVDLVTEFARPIPEMVICELLGVPRADHDRFRTLAAAKPGAPAKEVIQERLARFTDIGTYIRHLVVSKRERRTDDLLSDLTESDLTEDELAGVGGLLLVAGLDTTANMLALGTLALLRNPEQLALLRADPDLIDGAIEELLRYLSIAHTIGRAALADVEIAGKVIRAGETVLLSVQAADRDSTRFADPDTLDIRRNPVGHLAFGHGVHQCLGQQLARTEMRVAFPALLSRFPGLRLAVAPERIGFHGPFEIGGVRELPVTW